jgi:hypothetical protein
LTLKAPALASKQYISIIRLFNHCDISLDGEVNTSRIKKQLNAEFDFAKDGFIEVDDYSYNKNDVLEELDKPNFAERLVYHKKIWEQKSLLALLEKNEIDIYEVRNQIKTFANDEAFETFFSPYFVIPFNYVSRKYINENKISELGNWLLFDDFLQADEREEGLRTVRIFLDEKLKVLKNVNKDTYRSRRLEVINWVEAGAGKLLSNLPSDFYDVKEDIALHLINLTVAIQKTANRDCKDISRELTQVNDLSEELSDIITNNHRAYTGSSSSSSGNTDYRWVIWVVIILLRVASGGC